MQSLSFPIWVAQGFHQALGFSDLHLTSWICCPCSPRHVVPSQPALCSKAWGGAIYCQVAWIPSGTFGTSSPSRISNIIFISLVGEPSYLPALLSSTQGERLLLISLGLVRATSQIPRTNPFQGLASGREEMAGPQIQHQWDSRYSFHHTSVLRLYFVILLSDTTVCPFCPPPQSSPPPIPGMPLPFFKSSKMSFIILVLLQTASSLESLP